MSDPPYRVGQMTPAQLVELAARCGLQLRADSVRLEEAGLDYRVAFARDADGAERVLRVPRRPDVSATLGDPAIDFAYQHMMGPAAFDATVQAYREAGGAAHPRLGDRCAELAAAAPLLYGVFALQTGEPQHLAAAAAQLDPPQA